MENHLKYQFCLLRSDGVGVDPSHIAHIWGFWGCGGIDSYGVDILGVRARLIRFVGLVSYYVPLLRHLYLMLS